MLNVERAFMDKNWKLGARGCWLVRRKLLLLLVIGDVRRALLGGMVL